MMNVLTNDTDKFVIFRNHYELARIVSAEMLQRINRR